MLLDSIFYVFFSFIYSIYCQSIIRIGIIDDNNYDNPKGFVNINITNISFCGERDLYLQLYWIKPSNSLSDFYNQLELKQNFIHTYLTYTNKFYTKLIEDYSRLNHIPFIDIKSTESKTILCSLTTKLNQEYFLLPNILHGLINYLKFYQIKKLVYIYNNDESTYRIYELLKLMNNDEYFNRFSLDIRTIHYEDIYSLLYYIDSISFQKEKLTKYILLDLHTYDDYENIFEKISHMGLTTDSYNYIVLSTFDACLWLNKLNFVGRLIYFDYQENNCQFDNHFRRKRNENYYSQHPSFYYRSKLSFRSNNDLLKSLDVINNSTTNHSLLLNSCHKKIQKNFEYFSYSLLSSQLTKSSQFYSYTLFNSLNFLLQIYFSNNINCKTYRLKQIKNKTNSCQYSDMFIYSTRKSLTNQFKKEIQLIGRYSTKTNSYQSCSIDRSKDSISTNEKIFSSKIYYITSLFDEPFLMLRKGTDLQKKYEQPQANIKELRGWIFNFNELEGYCVELAEKVCSILNITCQFRIVEDGHFGSKNSSTGIWNGMIGEIVSRKADMAIAPLTISQVRMEVVDFSKPFMNLGISIMIRKPDKQKPGVFSFMNPVSSEIWLCLLLAYVAVSAVLFLTSRIVNSGWRRRVVRRPSYRSFSYPKSVNDRRKSEIQLQRQRCDSTLSQQSSEILPIQSARPSIRRRYHYRTRPLNQQSTDKTCKKNGKDKKSEESSVHSFGISNALFFSFASFMRQPINLVPKSLSGRVAATSWWYFSLIFISSYTANLVAFLTVENLVPPIKSVEELAKQQKIRYGSIKNGTTSAFFEKSNVTLFQHMWAVMQKSSAEVFVAINDEGVAKVRDSKGQYAFFIESTKNEYVNERKPCDTMKIGSDLDSKGYGIATRLGSDLTEAINIIITNLRETGFLDKLKQRWWYDRSQCPQVTKDKHFSELSLSSVTGLFYIFLFGIIVSCIIAFAEFIITAKNESEILNIDFREILRIKMIENMIGITIHTQRQLESGGIDNECNDHLNEEENDVIKQYTEYQLHKLLVQSDV